jgi:hypothetical protein
VTLKSVAFKEFSRASTLDRGRELHIRNSTVMSSVKHSPLGCILNEVVQVWPAQAQAVHASRHCLQYSVVQRRGHGRILGRLFAAGEYIVALHEVPEDPSL